MILPGGWVVNMVWWVASAIAITAYIWYRNR